MVTYVDAIALGNLNPIIREHGIDGVFFLRCALHEFQDIGIVPLQWNHITMHMPL